MSTPIQRLRSDAKRLKKAFWQGDNNAVERLRAEVPSPKTPRHADFLHVIARENGHSSWPDLKFDLETRDQSREQRAERLKLALYFGQGWIIKKLLQDDPTLPQHDFGLLVATYDWERVRSTIKQDPAAATRIVGVRSPILHLAYSQYYRFAPEQRGDVERIAALLVENGADVNDGYAAEPGSDHRISALYGALGHAGNMRLARWLLENGANPDDDESLYHATELGHTEGLKLLMQHGVSTRGTNALPRALDFNDVEAARLLLNYGADPNEAVDGHPSGQAVDSVPALHQAARRFCSAEIGALLLDHGADPGLVWEGHTAYATACIYGNREIAELLERRNASSRLSNTETILADCARGRAPVSALRQQNLSSGDRKLLTQLAGRPGHIQHLKALLAAGLDPNATEDMGMTPLHIAGWEGLSEHVALFLTFDADMSRRNAYGGDALGTVVHGAEFCPNARHRDHVTCARLLLEAGAELRPELVDVSGNEEMTMFLEGWERP